MINFEFILTNNESVTVECDETIANELSTSINNEPTFQISMGAKKVEEPMLREFWKQIKKIDFSKVMSFIISINETDEIINIDNINEKEFNCSYTIDFSNDNFIEHIDFNIA